VYTVVAVGDTTIEAALDMGLVHVYVIFPEAVKVALPPEQITPAPLILNVGEFKFEMEMLAVAISV